MYKFTRERHPRLSDQDLGRVAPYIFGPYKRIVPIWYQVGANDKLAEPISKTAASPLTLTVASLVGCCGGEGVLFTAEAQRKGTQRTQRENSPEAFLCALCGLSLRL